MAFLSGSLGYERFQVLGFEATTFDQSHLDLLAEHLIPKANWSDAEQVKSGFLAGEHVFDESFLAEKNLLHDTMQFGFRVDTNQVPSVIQKAWLQMELAARRDGDPSKRLTKALRQEAKDAVQDRCAAEAMSGKYRRMAQAPIMWDATQKTILFGGSGGLVLSEFGQTFESVFGVELIRQTAGSLANQWAKANDEVAAMESARPTAFLPIHADGDITWTNQDSELPDFLGNEFLVWLWWQTEQREGVISPDDSSSISVMFHKSLSLECPLGESGKQSLTSEHPSKLPEALESLRSGKLVRKAGLHIARGGYQFRFVLQAETFSVSSAKLEIEDDDQEYRLENRIEAIRYLNDTIDEMFGHFLKLRISPDWISTVSDIRTWLDSPATTGTQRSAA